VTVAEQWREMVTVALLGTDRREPPAPTPGVLADLAADERRDSPSQRMLQQAAACTVLRRAGVRPGPPCAPFAAPEDDPRPLTPPPATRTWRQISTNWPVLEDEWLLAVVTAGRRLSPELIGPLLVRHRTDVTRRARVLAAAGPLANWLVEHEPQLVTSTWRAPDLETLGELPGLPTLQELATVLSAPPDESAEVLAAGLNRGIFGISHRAVLINFVARVRPDALPAIADALDRVDPSLPAIGLSFSLADLARLRHRMLAELEPA
jgi:hypothetical protein